MNLKNIIVLFYCPCTCMFLPWQGSVFLAFCNHSESRRIFIHVTGDEDQIRVDSSPPRALSDKLLFFLKCSHASKLNRESIGHDVVYSECSRVPLVSFGTIEERIASYCLLCFTAGFILYHCHQFDCL